MNSVEIITTIISIIVAIAGIVGIFIVYFLSEDTGATNVTERRSLLRAGRIRFLWIILLFSMIILMISWRELALLCGLPCVVILGLIVFFIYTRRKYPILSCFVRIISTFGFTLILLGLATLTFTVMLIYPQWVYPCICPNSISDTDISELNLYTSWWPYQETHSSTFVQVQISPTPSTTPTVKPSQTQASSQLTPVGTPNVAIDQAFGPQYDVFVKATLSASAFDIDPQQQPRQSLDQKGVRFIWTVTPKYAGSQVLNISLTGIWRPKGGGEEIERPLAGHLLDVKVTDPASFWEFPPSLGQIVLIELIITFIGLVMNLPWIWIILKERREKKRLAGSPIEPMQVTANGQRYSESTTVLPSNRITVQETGKLQSHREGKLAPYINIYISYSSDPRDLTLLDELKKQLNVLQRQPNISLWEKQSILAGANWVQEVSVYINQAHLILCLVSPYFLSSDQCYEEMELAAKRMDTGEATVIPLLIHPTAEWRATPIGKLKPLPTDQVPISSQANQGKAISDIAEHVWHIIEQIRQNLSEKSL